MHLVLFVINKYGSLVFSRAFGTRAHGYSANELILQASSFHSMHAISSQITPPSLLPKETQLDAPVLDGIVEIVTDAFVLRNLQTLNGVKIVLVSDLSSQREQTSTLKKVQEAYADFVSKNPF